MVWMTVALSVIVVAYIAMIVAAVILLPNDIDGPEDD